MISIKKYDWYFCAVFLVNKMLNHHSEIVSFIQKSSEYFHQNIMEIIYKFFNENSIIN